MEAPVLIVAIAVNCAASPMTMRPLTAPRIWSAVAVPADGDVAQDAGVDGDPHPRASIAASPAALAQTCLVSLIRAERVP